MAVKKEELIVLRTPDEIRAEDLKKLASFRIMDDTFARPFFRKEAKLAEFVLRIITGLDDLEIDPTEYETQFDAKRMVGSRSLMLDVHGGDTKGRKYDLEMEKSDAFPERSEVHIATMVAEHLHSGDNFSDLPILYVIMVCDHDIIGNGRPVNEFMYLNTDFYKGNEEIESKLEAHASMGGRTHILYVNGDYGDEGSDIGKLIHDFKCPNPDDMYFDNLAKRTYELKETPKGVEAVCKAMEEERQVSNKENTLRLLVNLMQTQKWDAEKAMDALGILSDRDLYARSARFAISQQNASSAAAM